MPTFIFVRQSNLSDLHDALRQPINPHPPFSIMRFNGKIPLVGNTEIDVLRVIERRSTPKEKRRTFAAGQRVKLDQAGFTGLSGIVESGDGKYTLVCFGTMQIKVSTFLLETDGLSGT